MKHYVLGFYFSSDRKRVVLVRKNKPEWMKGRWNGIGGKIDEGENSFQSMLREGQEEIGREGTWCHKVTFTCPGGTVFVFAQICPIDMNMNISEMQREDEQLGLFLVDDLPVGVMGNLRYLIPLCLADIAPAVYINSMVLGIA